MKGNKRDLVGIWQVLLIDFCDVQLKGYLYHIMELERMTLRCRWELDICCSQFVRHQLQPQGNLSWILMTNRVGDQKQNIKKKETSPEKCDQAVEGLSTAKAKAKAKQVQESIKASQLVMQKFWARLLGISSMPQHTLLLLLLL
jgi:hypothetical protein